MNFKPREVLISYIGIGRIKIYLKDYSKRINGKIIIKLIPHNEYVIFLLTSRRAPTRTTNLEPYSSAYALREDMSILMQTQFYYNNSRIPTHCYFHDKTAIYGWRTTLI